MEILVVSYSRIGDTILATSLINHLIKKHSNAEFTVVTSTISKDIFIDMPRLKKLIVIDKQKYAGHWYKIWSFVKDIKWDLVVDLRSSYLSYFLEANERKIFKGNDHEHKLEQFSKFLQIEDNIEPTIWADEQNYDNILKSKKIGANYICVAPISNWQGKDWPIDKYFKLFEDPLFSDFEIVILGATDKASDNTKIRNLKESLSIKVNNLMNKADMIETYFILRNSKLFLGSDSSNMHLSVAAGIPTIGLFGPTNDMVYGPKGKKSFTVRTDKNYEKIINDKNFTLKDSPSYLKEIKVKTVLDKIRDMI